MSNVVPKDEEIPYFAIGNGELGDTVHAGDEIMCPYCGKMHVLRSGKDSNGKETEILLTYYCGIRSILAAVDNRLIGKFNVRRKQREEWDARDKLLAKKDSV